MLPSAPIERVQEFIDDGVDVALVVGTEASFGYIQAIARLAQRAGALLVEVNPSRTVLSESVDVRLEGAAGEVLSAMADGSRSTVHGTEND
jgi:NAD-dependent deacetylase